MRKNKKPIAGEAVCLTGRMWKKRIEIHNDIVAAGGSFATDAKFATILVVGDTSSHGLTKKKNTARSRGIPIIDDTELRRRLAVSVPHPIQVEEDDGVVPFEPADAEEIADAFELDPEESPQLSPDEKDDMAALLGETESAFDELDEVL